jgi:hypothetical protein
MLPVKETKQSDFVIKVVQYMVEVFVTSGDRASLLELLSKRCPECAGPYELIEFYLARNADKLKDPLLVLGDAYAECKVPEVRRRIARAFRRGFTTAGVRGKDDGEFVNNALQWYKKEKDHIVVNPQYRLWAAVWAHDEDDPVFRFMKDYDKIHPLFLKKP